MSVGKSTETKDLNRLISLEAHINRSQRDEESCLYRDFERGVRLRARKILYPSVSARNEGGRIPDRRDCALMRTVRDEQRGRRMKKRERERDRRDTFIMILRACSASFAPTPGSNHLADSPSRPLRVFPHRFLANKPAAMCLAACLRLSSHSPALPSPALPSFGLSGSTSSSGNKKR